MSLEKLVQLLKEIPVGLIDLVDGLLIEKRSLGCGGIRAGQGQFPAVAEFAELSGSDRGGAAVEAVEQPDQLMS